MPPNVATRGCFIPLFWSNVQLEASTEVQRLASRAIVGNACHLTKRDYLGRIPTAR